MALINCPECGKRISDLSDICVHCGYPINSHTGEDKEDNISSVSSAVQDDINRIMNGDTVEKGVSSGKDNNILVEEHNTVEQSGGKTKSLDIEQDVTLYRKIKRAIKEYQELDYVQKETIKERISGVFALIIIVAMVISLYSCSKGGCSSDSSASDAINAKSWAMIAVKDYLKSPSSADFCSTSSMRATNLGGNEWRVTGTVEAENSFGATIESDWSVTFTVTEDGYTDEIVIID